MDKKIVKRQILEKIFSHLKEKEITLILGPRQVGKTTLLFQLKEILEKKEKIAKENIYYFNLDLFSDLELFQSQNNFIQFIKNRVDSNNNRLYLFIDEAQRIENAGLFFKGIYDLNLPIKLVLTGSSSLEIRAKTTEPLTGRKRIFWLYPFSFYEYLLIFDNQLTSFLLKDDVYTRQKILNLFNHFVLFGGYPKVALEPQIEKKIIYLEEIFTSYLEKDIAGFLKIKDVFLFSKLVRILAEDIGQVVNVYRLASEIGIKGETLKRYLSFLEETFVLKRVLPYFSSTRAEIRKMPKIYFFDTGFRNFAKYTKETGRESLIDKEEWGVLLENFVFSELVKMGVAFNFWRTKDKAEVDFVLKKGEAEIPLEVKRSVDKNFTLSKSLISFIKAYQPKEAIVVNLSYYGKRKFDNTLIHFLLPYQLGKFLEENR
jgi:predicted AAA+ superfamily ATPase